jgi:hypothetical protein
MTAQRNRIEPLLSETVALAKHIGALIRQGLDRDAVLERLADPAGVGARMIERAIARRQDGAEFLAETVLHAVEPEPERTIRLRSWTAPDFDLVPSDE